MSKENSCDEDSRPVTLKEFNSFMNAMREEFQKLSLKMMDEQMTSSNSTRSRYEDRRSRKERHYSNREDDLGVKVNIPSFSGKPDPDEYLEWERRVEQVFRLHDYPEEKKVKLAALEFTNYASIWWDRLQIKRRTLGKGPIRTWEKLKASMRKQFVPSHYYNEMKRKLQRLHQGSMSAAEYDHEMELLMMKAGIEEDEETTMNRYIDGLRPEIRDEVEMYHFIDKEELVHKASKIEKRLEARYAGGIREEFRPTTEQIEEPKLKSIITKGNYDKSSSSKSNEIRCFKCQGIGHMKSQCPSKKTMFIHENGGCASECSSESNDDDMPPSEDVIEAVEHGEFLMATRALNIQPKEDPEKEQREHIFRTRGVVQNKICSVIIDGGSCTNLASTLLVEKLNLPTLKHPKPYTMQWLNDSGRACITKQVLVSFSIGTYQDELLCDVVPMTASHLLLGRPWQFDKRAQHDGYKNQFSFQHNGSKVKLVPLNSIQSYEDQLHIGRSFKKKGKVRSKDSRANPFKGRGNDEDPRAEM